jgi:hypothetical protein
MAQVELKHIVVRPRNPFIGWNCKIHAALTLLFIVLFLLVWISMCVPIRSPKNGHWAEGLLLILAATTTISSLALQLPAQNAVLAAVTIGALGGAAQAINGIAGIPFGPLLYNTEKVGHFLFFPLPWPVPILWVVVLLNARGVARLVLRPKRRDPYYGFWVIGLTILLSVVLELSFEPYATKVREYWSWKPTKLPTDWYGTPWTDFLGFAVVALVILLFVTPSLINKSPIPRLPTFHPLLAWELLSILFVTGTAGNHLWGASVLILVQMVLVGLLCWRGATTKSKEP